MNCGDPFCFSCQRARVDALRAERTPRGYTGADVTMMLDYGEAKALGDYLASVLARIELSGGLALWHARLSVNAHPHGVEICVDTKATIHGRRSTSATRRMFRATTLQSSLLAQTTSASCSRR